MWQDLHSHITVGWTADIGLLITDEWLAIRKDCFLRNMMYSLASVPLYDQYYLSLQSL
jgi:hypothetical protein